MKYWKVGKCTGKNYQIHPKEWWPLRHSPKEAESCVLGEEKIAGWCNYFILKGKSILMPILIISCVLFRGDCYSLRHTNNLTLEKKYAGKMSWNTVLFPYNTWNCLACEPAHLEHNRAQRRNRMAKVRDKIEENTFLAPLHQTPFCWIALLPACALD